MTPYDHRLTLLATEAKVRTPHIFILWHALQYPPFDPQAFASFTGLEARHVERMLAALTEAGLMPALPSSRKRRQPVEDSLPRLVRGTRLPDPFQVPDEWILWAQTERHWHRETADKEMKKFCDYWHGESGSRAVKKDWFAVWRNRVRSEWVAADQDWKSDGAGKVWTPEAWRAECERMATFYESISRDWEASQWRVKPLPPA